MRLERTTTSCVTLAQARAKSHIPHTGSVHGHDRALTSQLYLHYRFPMSRRVCFAPACRDNRTCRSTWEWAQKPLSSLVVVSVREPALAGQRRLG